MRRTLLRSVFITGLAAAVLAGCAATREAREPDESGAEPMLATANVPHAVVAEAFVTPTTPADNVDSPAAWMDAAGDVLLIATAKKTGVLKRYDGETGALRADVGSRGAGAGQFDRPNGLFVVDDLVFVVERDNHRVQVLRLPAFTAVGHFGAADLVQPYGLWLRRTGAGAYDVLVSDAYMAGKDARGDDIVPPLDALGARFKRYAVTIDGSGVQALRGADIGDTKAAGAIRIPESLWGDEAHARLLVAEEDTATGTAVREYAIDGRFRGRTLGLGLFKAQAEGIALWSCADGSGYWIATDQFKDRSLFHLFDRETLAHIGGFAGEVVGNTDGIWLHQGATPRFPAGVFYAVHDDMGVGAFDWRDIARALKLRERCD